MDLTLNFLLLLVGLVSLWKSGKMSVENAIGVSVIYGIEKFTIGFFIFAISTGLPEISSAVVSSVKKVPELSSGDLMGSSFVNMSMVLGVVLFMAKSIEIDALLKKKLYKTISLIVLIFLGLAFSPQENILTGILLIAVYFGSVFWFQAGIPKKAATKEIEEVEEKIEKIEEKAKLPPKLDVVLRLLGSLLFLIISSWITIHASTKIAFLLKIDLTIVGAVFIAIGTSFPELSLEIHAVKQKEYGLALGDIFGSSLLNISLVLGILTLINPDLNLGFARQILPFILAVILWAVQKFVRKKPLTRLDGGIFLVLFLAYLFWIVFSQI